MIAREANDCVARDVYAAETIDALLFRGIRLDQRQTLFLVVHFGSHALACCGGRALYKLLLKSRAPSSSSGDGYVRLKIRADGCSKFLSPFGCSLFGCELSPAAMSRPGEFDCD